MGRTLLRKPPNERPKLKLKHPLPSRVRESLAELKPEPSAPSPEGKDTERRCIVTGQRADRSTLVRLALSPEGEVLPDVRAKAPGRGAWIGVDRRALEEAQRKGRLKSALARAFRGQAFRIPDDLGARIEQALERVALDRLGLEARGGTLVTGGEKIEAAARAGKIQLLLHAADAGADGNRKLDQALRVGNDAEGSGLGGLVIAAPRTILSLALGRENVVHVALTDRGAAERVGDALARWHKFIGFKSEGQPCETGSQGPIAVVSDETAAVEQ